MERACTSDRGAPTGTGSRSRTIPLGAPFGWCAFKATAVLVAIAAALLAAGGSLSAAGPEPHAVRLEGLYTYRNVNPVLVGNIQLSNTGFFQVTVQGTRWIISFESLSAKVDPNALYGRVDASCDGTNVYVVHTMSPALIRQGVDPVEAKFYPGVLAPPLEREPYNLWLAFISSLVWTNSTGAGKPPNTPDLSLFYNTNFFCFYSWEAPQGEPCVRKLVLRSPGRILTRDLRRNGRLRYVSLPPPYANGYLMGLGCWRAMTNFWGLVAPTRYEFSYFRRKQDAASEADLTEGYRCECVVTNAYEVSGQLRIPAGLPEAGWVFVTDHRFAHQGRATVRYSLTNQWSPAVAERVNRFAMAAPKQSLEEQALQQHGFKPPAPAGSAPLRVVRVLLGAAFLLPPLAIGARWLVSRKTTTTRTP